MLLNRTTLRRLCPIALLTVLAACRPDMPDANGRAALSGDPVVLQAATGGIGEELLPNGDFDEWYAGLPSPTGFDAPTNTEISRVARDRRFGHLGAGGYTARQTWQAFDLAEAPGSRFGTTVELDPGQVYELSVIASTTPGMVATIGAYAVDAGGEPALLAGRLVEVSGEEPARYTGKFRVGDEGTVLLGASASPLAALPGTVSWSAWSLRRAAPEAVYPSGTLAAWRDRWSGHTLDHLRRQFALYGGAASWSAALNTIYSNFGRVRRETEGHAGNAIQGYDQYIFQKVDLDYLRGVRDFVSEPAPGGPAYRPAFRALVALDRALAARGIALVVLPLPDRIHLVPDRIHRPAADLPPAYLPHAALLEALLEQGVVAVDVAPLLRHRSAEGAPIYWRTDYGVPSYTLRELAAYAAPLVRELVGMPPGGGACTEVAVETSLHQGAIPCLPPHIQKIIEPESRTVYAVHDGEGRPVVPAPGGDVLVVGSLASLHGPLGASLAAHLARETGRPVSVLRPDRHDQEVPRYLMENGPPELETAKVVVFSFPEYALVRPGW